MIRIPRLNNQLVLLKHLNVCKDIVSNVIINSSCDPKLYLWILKQITNNDLFIADKATMRNIIEDFKNNFNLYTMAYGNKKYLHFNQNINVEFDSKDIKQIFYYKKFRDDYGTELLQNLETDVCPYCNTNDIHVVKKSGTSAYVKPAFDHFFPRSLFPYLGLSLFNLIPACTLCNGPSVKREFDTYKYDIINPHEEDFQNSYLFHSTYNFFDDKYYVKMRPNGLVSPVTERSIQLFVLEERYQAKQILIKSIEKRYKETLSRHNGNAAGAGNNMSKHEIVKLIFGDLSKENLGKTPYSKFIRDTLISIDSTLKNILL